MDPTLPNNPDLEPAVKPTSSWSKPLLYSSLGLLVLGGSVFAAYQMGKNSNESGGVSPTVTQILTATPTPAATLTPSNVALSDDTTGWKVFSNSQNSYTLKYPPTWVYKVNKGSQSQISFDTDTQALEAAVEGGAVVITVSNKVETPLIQFDGRNKAVNSKSIEIGGQSGQQAEIQDAGTGEVSYIQSAVAYKGKTYYFNLHKLDQRAVYNQLLGTVQFTN